MIAIKTVTPSRLPMIIPAKTPSVLNRIKLKIDKMIIQKVQYNVKKK
jgi:hypothetical protein